MTEEEFLQEYIDIKIAQERVMITSIVILSLMAILMVLYVCN